MSSTESTKPKPSWIVRFLDKLGEGLLPSVALGFGGLLLTAAITLLSQMYLYQDWCLAPLGTVHSPQ